jgi:prepilin-type N-terminal cleavage/methylation domain-containing protein
MKHRSRAGRRSQAPRGCAPRGFAPRGFSLIELLVALTIGMLLSTLVVQTLLAEGRISERLARRLVERAAQRRTLELVRSDAVRADRVTINGTAASACPAGGRRQVLALDTSEGPITYTVGSPPSAIWRGQVLMRCGPAYGLHGEPSAGAAQNRVVIDALAGPGFEARALEAGLLRLMLHQGVSGAGGALSIDSELVIAAAAEAEGG